MHDWLILMLLVVIEVILNVIEPFHRFVGKDMLTDLSYPLKDNTVPTWAVPVCFRFTKIIITKERLFFEIQLYDNFVKQCSLSHNRLLQYCCL